MAESLRSLLGWTRSGAPSTSGEAMLLDMFPHPCGVAPLGATGQYPAEIITAVHGPVNGEVR
jgi:hypothetical protein